MKRQSEKNNRGVMVLELIIALGILALIGGAVATFSVDIFKTSGSIQSSLSAQQDARALLRQLAAELRTASPSSTGAYSLAEVGDNRLRFYSNIDNDGLKEEVIYYLSLDGKTLYKDVRKPSGAPLQYTGAFTASTVMRDVANGATPVFSYYDTSYDGTTAPLSQPVNIISVRLVKATIIIERNPNRSPTPITVTTQVAIRNLKDNL